MSHVSFLIAAEIQKFFSSKVYYKIFFCMLTLLIQANSPVHAAGIVNYLHVKIMVITTWAQLRGWEQNIQLRSAVQISFLHREQKMWILPIHQKTCSILKLAYPQVAWKHKEKKAFLMSDNEKHGWLSDLKLFNTHIHTHTHRLREKYLKKFEIKWKKLLITVDIN